MRKDNRPPKEERTLKRGDIRDDGLVFCHYCATCTNGEVWKSSEELAVIKQSDSVKYDKGYYDRNKEKIKAKRKAYYKENKEKMVKKAVESQKKRRENSPRYRAEMGCRGRIWRAVRNVGGEKSQKSMELTGCDKEALMAHLESQFAEGMSWDNYGLHGWHIDHIRPCASFDLTLDEEQRKCFHYTNLQPLWAKDNLSKGDKYDG
tara:strand:- start:58 stop:672 length:615 start_codon:yes stop_codon:yes gene_type:complete